MNINMSTLESRLYRCPTSDYDITFDIWGFPSVISADELISPRPLGPTHMLILHADPTHPTPSASFLDKKPRNPQMLQTKKPLPPLPYSNVIEIPINDLIFCLNVPNLSPSLHTTTKRRPALPPRLHKELPRVLLGPVPHLETFPDLVVYLHTQNQAELFRKLIPEWIRDSVHPLRDLSDDVPWDGNEMVGSSLHSAHPRISSGIGRVPTLARRRPRQLFGKLLPGYVGSGSSLESVGSMMTTTTSRSLYLGNESIYERTFISIIQDIATASHDHSITPSASVYDEGNRNHDCGRDPLLHTVLRLNSLLDNLEYIGHFRKGLWCELDFYRMVLVRAISWRARIDGEESD